MNDDAQVEAGWAGSLLETLELDGGLAAAQGLNWLTGGRIDGCGIAWNSHWQAIQVGHRQEFVPEPGRRGIFGVSATAALDRRTRTALLGCAAPTGI